MKLELQENREEQSAVIQVEGSVDTLTAPELERFLSRHYASFTKIVLDLAGVPYISSAGLRVLLKANNAMHGGNGFALKNVAPDVLEVLELTGFGEIITILS